MSEEKKSEIQEVLKDAKSKNKRGAINIQGSGNIIGDGNSVTQIRTEKIVQKTEAVPAQGVIHITEAQGRKLRELIGELVKLHNKIKRKELKFSAAWTMLYKKMNVSSFRFIPLEQYEIAESFLRQKIGSLNSMKSAPKKNEDWRKAKYRYIHTNTKTEELKAKKTQYLEEKYGVNSLKELDDKQLQAFYQVVAGWKRRGRK